MPSIRTMSKMLSSVLNKVDTNIYSIIEQEKSKIENIKINKIIDDFDTTVEKIYKKQQEYLFTDHTRKQSEQELQNIWQDRISSISKNAQHSSTNTFVEKTKKNLISSSVAIVLALFGGPAFSWVSIPFILYSSRDVYKKFYFTTKQKKVTSTTIVTISLAGCILTQHFIIAAIVTTVVNSVGILTNKITSDSKQCLVEVFVDTPETIWLVINEVEVEIPFEELRLGDIVVFQAGQAICVDGVITEGTGSVDQHVLTGEAQLVEKWVGENVFSSTLLLSGKIYVKVTATGKQTTAGKIFEVLSNTLDYKSQIQFRAETISQNLVYPILIAGGIAFPIYGFTGLIAAFNTHPKNKMLILSPISILNYFSQALDIGILIKDGRSLELLQEIDTVVFDKTGTLTEEQPTVQSIISYSKYTEIEILKYASALEQKQNHPIAKAILQFADQKEITIPSIANSEYKLGYGLTAIIDKDTIHLGSFRLMENIINEIPEQAILDQKECHKQGHSIVFIAINQKLAGAIELIPTIRPEVNSVIEKLRQNPRIKKICIISGDHEQPTKNLSERLGIDQYFAEALPTDKASIIDSLQQEGHSVCYIGDGINDSVALKKAFVSVSLKGASTIAIDTAQVVLLNGRLNRLPLLFELSDNYNKNINTTFAIVLMPTVIGISGVFVLGFTIVQTMTLNILGLLCGVGHVLLKKDKINKKKNC